MKNCEINYSVIIRTTGNAGEKYKKLLESIKASEPAPKEVIVVLPEGYELPKEQLGTETFYFSPKGMVIQRLVGIEKCKTRYALIIDDDISFNSDFVEKLYIPLCEGNFGVSIGPLLDFFPQGKKQRIVSALMGQAIPTLSNNEFYNKVLKTTGYLYNTKIKVGEPRYYETQSAPWTCFFADVDKLRSIHFEDELWLDRNGYSAHDDTAMFYKIWLRGIKTVVVADALYEHLDAKTSSKGNQEKVNYAYGFNTVVFWHRFIKSEESNSLKQLWSSICIHYRFFSQRIFNALCVRRGIMSVIEQKAYVQGWIEGNKWIRSQDYLNLLPIRRL